MTGSDQDGTDQSLLGEGTHCRVDEEQIETAHEEAVGDTVPDQDKVTTEDSTQRSIRDMLDDEGRHQSSSIETLSSQTQSSMRSESSVVTINLNLLSHF